MYAVVGTFLIAVTILGFTIMTFATRKPNPAKWARHVLVHEAIAIGAVSCGSYGVAAVVQSIGQVREEPLTAVQIVSIAAIVVAFVFVWRRLKVGATLAAYEAQTGSATQASRGAARTAAVAAVLTAAPATPTPEDPSSPTRPRTPNLPKKAA